MKTELTADEMRDYVAELRRDVFNLKDVNASLRNEVDRLTKVLEVAKIMELYAGRFLQ